MLTNLIINHQLIRLCFKLDQLFFCFALASNVASDIAGLIRRDAGVCFILITRSGVEEMKSERKRKRGVTRNWRNYDFKRLSPCPPFVLPRASHSPFLGEGKKRARAKSLLVSIRVAEVAEVYYWDVALNFYPIWIRFSHAIHKLQIAYMCALHTFKYVYQTKSDNVKLNRSKSLSLNEAETFVKTQSNFRLASYDRISHICDYSRDACAYICVYTWKKKYYIQRSVVNAIALFSPTVFSFFTLSSSPGTMSEILRDSLLTDRDTSHDMSLIFDAAVPRRNRKSMARRCHRRSSSYATAQSSKLQDERRGPALRRIKLIGPWDIASAVLRS